MKKILKIIWIVIVSISIVIIGLWGYTKICFNPIVISGDSMMNTLYDGQVGYERKIELVKEINRGDIITFRKDNKSIVKRIIGLPNETIRLRNNTVYINGEVLEELYLSDENKTEITNHGIYSNMTVELKANEYSVMGDNRMNSYDSRYYGPVSYDQFIGKVRVIYGQGKCEDECSDFTDFRYIPWIFF